MTTSAPLVLWIPGQPVPKGRPRFGNGRTYTDTKTRDAEDYLRWKLKEAKAKPFDGALRVDMHFHRADRRGVDIDNLQKTLLDAAHGFCFKNDSQIVELHAYLERGSEDPGTWLKVTQL